MILFGISFLLIFVSSYLITCIISPKKSILGFIYLFLVAFAQIVLTFELLSLFSAIKEVWVLAFNILFSIVSFLVWNKKGKPLWSLEFNEFFKRVLNSFKLDKSLILLFIGFCTFILSVLFICLIMPVTNADSLGYHVARSLFWISQRNLNHFNVADIRCLCLPINSEILYTWVLLFIKKDLFLGFFAFVGYILSIVSVYNILGYLGFCTRKKLWTIFILSSLAFVIVQASSTETDIIIAGLISSCIFLFWYALKNNKMTPIFMASLAYAIAVGTKTTAIIAMPGVGLFLLFLCYHFKKYKPFAWFLGFGFLNFLVFSSYNYILNFIQFSNFMGSESFMVVSKNYYGIKGMFANFVKYIFMFFDFTGFPIGDYLRTYILELRSIFLSFLHLSYVHDGLYTSGYDIQTTLYDQIMGAGVLGMFVVLPCLLYALVKPLFNFRYRKVKFIFAFAALLIINLFVISYLLAYMTYSIRFLMSFVVLASPILTYSYFSNKNPLKYIIIFCALFYLMGVSTHLWLRPVFKTAKLMLFNHSSITDIRTRAACKNFEIPTYYLNEACVLKFNIENNFTKENKILIFMNTPDRIYIVKELELQGYKLDFATLEDANKIDFNKYNIIILPADNSQIATFVKDYAKRKGECIFRNGKFYLKGGVFVPCIYIQNETLPKPKGNKEFAPYQVECAVTKNFLEQKNLKYLYKTGIFYIKSKDGKAYYMIYSNGNLPLKLKHPIKQYYKKAN